MALSQFHERECFTMTTLQVPLDDRRKAFVEQQMAAEGFASETDYFLALLDEAQKRKVWSVVEQLALEGLDSPKQEMTKQDWGNLRLLVPRRK